MSPPPIGPPPASSVRAAAGAGVVHSRPTPSGRARIRGEGLVARFQPIKHVTPKGVLDRKLWLPAILNTATLTESALHNEYDTLSAGQFSQAARGGPNVVTQLRELPLDTLTLAWNAPWLVVEGQNAQWVRDALKRILRSREPVHLLLYFHPHPGTAPEVDMNVTLRSETREIRPAEHDTHYMNVQVKEWRDPRTPVNSSRPTGQRSSRKKGISFPATATLKVADTMASLAFEFYGTYSVWRLIRDANGIPTRWGQKTPLVKLGGKFRVGGKVKIPKPPPIGPVPGSG